MGVRNRVEGRVVEIIRGGAVGEVDVETGAGVFTSVITVRNIEEMGLKVGDRVSVQVKATDVFLDKL